MSLSKIGKLTNTIKSINSGAKNGKDLVSTLRDFGDIKSAAKYLAKSNAGTTYKTKDLKRMLYGAYKNSTTEEDAADILDKALEKSSTVMDTGFSLKEIGDSLKNTGSGLLTFIKPFAPLLIGAALAGVGYAGFKFLDNQFDLTKATTTKKYQKAQEKNETAQSDLETAQSEYDSNQDRIQELRAKENRSLEESQELNTLQNQNELLGAQVSLKQRLADSAKTAEADAAQKDLNKKSMQQDYFSDGSGIYNPQAKVYVNDLDEAQAKMDYIQHLQDRYDTAYENIKKGHGGNMDLITEEENKTLEKQQEGIDTQKSELSEMISNISDQSQSMLKDDGTVLDKKYQGTIDQVNSLIDDYSNLMGSASGTEDKLNNLFALADYADLQSKLESIGKSKGSKGILDALNSNKDYADLKSTLEDKNVSQDDLASYIMAIADPEALNIEGVKENLKDKFAFMSKLPSTSGGSIAEDFFKDKSNKDIETFWNYLQNNGLDPEENNWGIGTLTSNWNKAMKESKASSEDTSKTFSSLFKNSAEDTASDIDTVTDNFQSNISSIKSAMDSLKSGDMKSSDITDLIQQFPELATETDDLQTGLQKLATDKASTAIGKIRDAVKDTTDPKELAAADKYVQSILDGINTAGFDMSADDIKKTVRNNILDNAKGTVAKDSAVSTMNKLMSEYGDNEIAMQAILKLSLDPSMANASYEEWKSAIEDTEVQVRLDANDQDLENLSKDLTRLQTDASDMQTLMNNKSAFNQKATAQDYNNLVENGNAQISNLNQQIKDYQDNIRTIRESKGISPLTDEDNEKIKGYQDQIQSAQMSIENMKASQAGWLEDIANLPITDVTNLASALSTAIGETNSETGLTSDSVKNLVTQFSDLTAQGTDISNLFSRSADGLKLNTERFKDLSKIQNQMVMDDFAKQIKAQQDAIADPKNANNIDAHKAKLEELKNLQAEYMAQYEGMQSQLSDFQIMQNSKSEPNEGSEYTQAKSDLEAAKELYDQGLTGTPQFKKTAKYFSQGGFEDADNFIENYNALKDYYTEDFSGPKKFLNDLNAKGLATYETLADGNKQWTLSFSDTETAANQMGMSLESFESILGRLGDYDFVNTFVSSIADGENQIDDLTDQLIEEQGKLSKMRTDGASEQQIKDQEEVVNGLQQQISDTKQATNDYAAGEGERQAKSLAEAKQQIDDYNKYRQEALSQGDTELAQKYEDKIQEVADEKGIKLKVDSFEVDENAYNQLSHEQGIGTFDSPLTAEEMGISDPTAAKEYANSLEAVKQAHEANAEATEADFNALKQYTAADLEGIQLGDGAYNVEGMEQAEDALQNLADQAGLTKDQLVQALEGLGILKPEVDSSEIEEAGEKAEETSADLQNLSGSKYTIEADLSTSGGTEDLTNSLASIPQGTTATVDVEVNGEDQVENLTSAMESVPDNTPVTITCDVQNQEELDTINAKADELNAQGKQITVNATIKKDSKDVDSYKPADKEGKAIYHVNASEVNAWTPPVKGGTVNYTADGSSIDSWTPPQKSGTVIYHAQVVGAPSGGGIQPAASGSMTSIAHADGTAYNMLNLKSLSSAHAGGNVALSQNETALTNEVGTESIVRDGVWSLLPGGPHFENLKKGDIIFNASQTKDLLEHGKTNSNARAYATGTLSVNAYRAGSSYNGGGKEPTGSKSGNSSSSSTRNSRSNSNSGSSNSSGKSSSSSSKWEDVWKNIIDWFERLVKKFENRIDLAQAKAENTSNLVSQNKYLNSAITDTTKLIKYYGQGRKMYVRESDKYAKKIGLSSGLKKKVQNGTVKLENLSEDNKQKVEAYQKWYDKINECKKAIQDLKKQELELYQQKLTNITDKYDALIGVYSSYSSTLESLNSWREEAGNSQAPNSAYANTIKAQYTAGQQQSKLMLDEIQKYQTEYNNLVKRYGSDHTASKEAKAKLEELKTAYYDNQKAMTEYQNKLKELQLTYDQWQVDKYTSASDRLSNERDYKDKNNYKGSGNDLTETDYLDAIKINDKTMIALSQRRKDIIEQMKDPNINSEKYQDLKKELDDVDKSTYDAANSTVSLKKELVDLRFKPFEDAQEDLENYIDNLNDLQDMMDSDTFLNDDGSFTSHGLANIVLTGKQMEAYKQQVADYRKQLENIQELYDNGMLTEKEYEDQTKSTIDNINKAAKNLYSSQSNMLKTYEDQITKVNDSLKDNIDKRQKALEAKKDYYDFDKTLKDKNKDINALKAQIAALEGTTNASAKARLAQLKADLKDKEDDLADTKYEHQVDMESKGYDNLSDQADDALEKTLQAVKSNSELQKAIIDNMLKETQKSYSDAYGEINKIIEETGYKTSTMFNDLINKAELTNKKVKEVISGNYTNIDTSGIDGKRPDKGKADEGLNNTRNQSSTGQAASSEPAGAGSNNDEPKTVEQLLAKPTTSGKSTTTNQDAAEKAKRDKHNAMMLALQAWYKKIGKYTGSKEEIKNHSDLIQYFWKKGKYVRSKDLVKVAGILGHTSLSKKKYSTWTAKQKTQLLNELKNYGFSQGGVVRQLIPADANDLIGKAIIKNGDTGFITARAGETVLTEEFTKQLKPTVQSMNAFNEVMSGKGISAASAPKSYQNQNITFNPEITVNVDSISNDLDIKQLGKQLSDVMYGDFTKRMRKDLSRSTGRNR